MSANAGVGILGIGSALPTRVLTNLDLEKTLETSDEWIRTRTGICERRIAEDAVCTSDLAAEAARAAMHHAGVGVEEIDLIILATATPDVPLPATACYVQAKLGAVHAAAFDVAAGCTGFVYALSIGRQFVATGACRYVLVIGAEILSRILDWKDRATCVLFGDGAGAVVLGPVPAGQGLLSFRLGSDGTYADMLSIPAGGSKLPASLATVEARLHFLQMSGHEVFKFAVRVMGEVTTQALDELGLTKADLDFLVPHQANLRIIDAARKRFDLPEERVIVNIERYGNMSSASIPVALEEAIQSGRLKKGDLVAMVGFGAGLTWGAAIMRY